MAYTITLSDGTTLTSVLDGTTNSTSTSITLIGKNFAGFGQFQNNDLVHMLENFSNNTAPQNPLRGQLWYQASGNLNVYTGNVWKTLSTGFISNTEPNVTLSIGDQWYDTQNDQLNVYNGSDWDLVGPLYSNSQGRSGVVVETITDTANIARVAVSLYTANTRVAILSNVTTYTPNVAISGFANINPGFNLSTSVPNNKYWGSAFNSDRLGNVAASNYALLTGATFTGAVGVGTSGQIVINVSGNSSSITNNAANGNIVLGASVSGNVTNLLVISGSTNSVITNKILPSTTDVYDIGSNVARYGNIYAKGFVGDSFIISNSSFSTPISVSSGGLGVNTIPYGSVILGNNTSPVLSVAPGALGNVLVSNGSIWQSQALGTGVTSIAALNAFVAVTAPTGSVGISIPANANGYGTRTVSASAPAGGNNGDLWFQI